MCHCVVVSKEAPKYPADLLRLAGNRHTKRKMINGQIKFNYDSLQVIVCPFCEHIKLHIDILMLLYVIIYCYYYYLVVGLTFRINVFEAMWGPLGSKALACAGPRATSASPGARRKGTADVWGARPWRFPRCSALEVSTQLLRKRWKNRG